MSKEFWEHENDEIHFDTLVERYQTQITVDIQTIKEEDYMNT